ncbi:MAG: enoyl-CoA hydratase [Pseudomonadales bacterium]
MNERIPVNVTIDNQVMTISWDRPDKKNALTQAMYGAAADALLDAENDNNVRVVILTGTHDCFTAGNDLNDFLNNPAIGDDTPVARFLAAIASFKKPIIAAVNGPAVGVGTTMLLHCDMVVAADTSVFSMPFSKLGVCPEAASSYLLPLMAGYHRAAELLLLGENFDANTARDCGIVNRIAPSAEYQTLARKLAETMAQLPPNSLRTTKAFLKSSMEQVVSTRMKEEADVFGKMIQGPEAVEAMTAFTERRPADFSKF